jgi:ribosomal peptide maturation radical SAM protein 1
MKKVLLISMPFGTLDRPALGISLLKANLQHQGYPCDIRYFTFTFAEHIGFEAYQWITNELPYTAFAGDWLFISSLYGERPTIDQQYITDVLQQQWNINNRDIQRLIECRSAIPRFINSCMQEVQWYEYGVIGFTSTFVQNIASLALAKKINQKYPEIKILFGGANWEEQMGLELHRQFNFVDYVCSGEGDVTLPKLVQQIFHPQTFNLDDIRGIVYRSNTGESIFTGTADPIHDLNSLPIPDFSEYFSNLEKSTVGSQIIPQLLMETARGCWWAAKSHCKFCGLNGNSIAFRSKSPARAIEELLQLVNRWKVDLVGVVDNILDMHYFKSMLPELAQCNQPIKLFYEVKANLSREQLGLLKQAGVYRIQPGIESLSDRILALMGKGTTALRNIQLLKWCREYGIGVDWNMLYGFPSESQQDYNEILKFLPSIRFLGAPTGYGAIRLDRFSPYFNHSERYGLINVRALSSYQYLYPFDELILKRIAYYFDFDYHPTVDPTGYAQVVVAYIQDWQQHPELGSLTAIEQPHGDLILQDSRSDTYYPQVKLEGLEKCVYQYCDQVHSLPSIMRHLHAHFPETHCSEESVKKFLESLVANNLMVSDGKNYLSLALYLESLHKKHMPREEHHLTNELAALK